MDDSALEALVAVLQADHALHVRRCCLLSGQAECDWSLRDLLATLRWEVAHNLSLGEIENTMLKIHTTTEEVKNEEMTFTVGIYRSGCKKKL